MELGCIGRFVVVEPILVETSHEGISHVGRLAPRSLSTVLNDFSDAVAMLVGVLQLSAPIGVGIGRYTLRLAAEYLRVVAKTTLHDAAVGELEEAQQQRVPAIHERHKLIVVYLHHVVAAQLRQMAQQLPHHSQAAELAPTPVAAQVDVARSIVPAIAVRHGQHAVSTLKESFLQCVVKKARLAYQQYLHISSFL